MTTFTAYFRTDAEFASREFEANTPKQALRMARKFLDTNVEDLVFEEYGGGMPVNEIAIKDQHRDEVAVWYDEELSVRLAASDLLNALEGQTAAAQSVIENWATGDLAAAVRTLDASISAARAALAKAKGDGQ
jgi:hypothetical protein